MIIAAQGATLSGGGSLTLSNQSSNRIQGANAGATLTNVDNTISGAGALGGGQMVLVNKAAGIINANVGRSLTIDTGLNTISNAGLIESNGVGGLFVQSAISNTGLLSAIAGVLTLNGAVSGAGVVQANGGVLVVNASLTGSGSLKVLSGSAIFNNGSTLGTATALQSGAGSTVTINGSVTSTANWTQSAGNHLGIVRREPTGGRREQLRRDLARQRAPSPSPAARPPCPGALAGRGTLTFAGGSEVLATGVALTTANWTINAGSVAVGAKPDLRWRAQRERRHIELEQE